MSCHCIKKPKSSYSLHEPKQHVVELYVKNMKLKGLKNGSLANDLFSAFEASAMKGFGKMRKSKKTDQCCLQHCCMQSCQQGIGKEKRECWPLSGECVQGERSSNLS